MVAVAKAGDETVADLPDVQKARTYTLAPGDRVDGVS
jgi:hypothetical protein